MPHFVVFQGMKGNVKTYQVHFQSEFRSVDGKQTLFHSDGTEWFPQPVDVVEIPDFVAKLPLDLLTDIYKNGRRTGYPVESTSANLTINIATVKLRRIKTHGTH